MQVVCLDVNGFANGNQGIQTEKYKEATDAKLLWKFDCNPKDAKYDLGGAGRKCDFIASPVIYNNRLYIGTGQDPEHFSGAADLWCVDLKKAADGGAKSVDRVSRRFWSRNVK